MNRNIWLTRLVCVALISILNVHFSVASAQESSRAAKTNVTVGGNIFGGGNNANVSGNSAVLINQANAQVGLRDENNKLVKNTGSVYGGGALANVGTSSSNTTTVTLTNGTAQGSVYGGGLGQKNGVNGATSDIAALVYGNVTVTLNGGIADSVFGCNNLNGAPQNSVQVNITSGNANYVFGGGNVAAYGGTPDVNVSGGQVYVVYGGGNEAGTGGTDVALSGTAMVVRGIYGGCNTSGTVTGDAQVTLTGGQVGTSMTNKAHGIFGGGYGQPTRVDGSVVVTLDSVIVSEAVQKPLIYGNIYGGSALGNVNSGSINTTTKVNTASKTTTVNAMAGTIYGEVYGGGLGDTTLLGEGHSNVAALVHGQVTVNIGRNNSGTYEGSAQIRGSVYGCNNVNGTPEDDVYVHVYKTFRRTHDAVDDVSLNRTYALDSVFGGGHNAHYQPENNNVDSQKKIYTHVYGCDNTIKEVFGGGNAADAVGVNTVIDGGRYQEVFGGGNGVIKASNIGKGKVYLKFASGRVGVIFGGCNRQGTVTGGDANITIEEGGGSCNNGKVDIDYHFCGGNYTDVIAEINQVMTCAANDKYLGLYGGCRLGTVYGNVTLTIEGGNFGSVFGGSLGAGDYAANIRKYPTAAQVEADLNSGHPRFTPEDLAYMIDHPELQGTGGNITVILKGGKIENVFGGCDQNGNVEGKIIIIIDSTETGTCALDVDYVYGGSNLSPYRPLDSTATTPIINLVKGHVNHDVFGGGRGNSVDDLFSAINAGLVTSNPKIVMGADQKVDYATWITNHITNPSVETVPWTTATADDKKFWVKGNIYGGGEMARVGKYSTSGDDLVCDANTGKTTVEIAAGKVGPRTLVMPMDSGMVFGAGKGIVGDPATNANIPLLNYVNNTEVIIGKESDHSGPFIKGSVYGGSQNGHVLHDTWVKIQGGQIGCGWDASQATDAQRDLNCAYTDAEWVYADHPSLFECNSWAYASPWAPYDMYASTASGHEEEYAHLLWQCLRRRLGLLPLRPGQMARVGRCCLRQHSCRCQWRPYPHQPLRRQRTDRREG